MGILPIESKLVLKADGYVHRVIIKHGDIKDTYPPSDGVVLGKIEDIERDRRDLLEKIEGYGVDAPRPITPFDYKPGEPLRAFLAAIDNERQIRVWLGQDKRDGASVCYIDRLEEIIAGVDAAVVDEQPEPEPVNEEKPKKKATKKATKK